MQTLYILLPSGVTKPGPTRAQAYPGPGLPGPRPTRAQAYPGPGPGVSNQVTPTELAIE